MFERIKAVFTNSAPVSLPQESTAYSGDSLLYNTADFEKYNPDSLIRRKGHDIYKKMMIDEQVKAVIKFKRDAITGRDYYFDLDTDELSETEKERRIAIFDKMIEQVTGSFVDVLNKVMAAYYQGYSISEKLYNQFTYNNLIYWGFRGVRKKPYQTFSFSVDEFGETTKFVQKIGAKERELDQAKFIHFVINPDVDEHYGQSELREAYRSWWSKDNIIKFWNIWMERHAAGLTTVTPEKGVTLKKGSPEYNDLIAALNNLQTKSFLIMPPGIKAEANFPTNNIAYENAIKFHNSGIAKSLLVPNLLGVTEQYGYGSYSQSNTQLEAFFWTLDADADRLEETLNEQLFKELGLVNFNDELYPRFRFKPVSNAMKLEIVTKWNDMVQGGTVEVTDTDEKHVRDLMDFPDKGEPLKKSSPPSGQPQEGQTGNNQPALAGGPTPSPPQPGGGGTPSKDRQVPSRKSKPGETIMGSGTVTIEMVRAAEARVNFSRIDEQSTQVVDDNVEQASSQVVGMLKTVIGNLKEIYTDQGVDITKFKIPPKFSRGLNKQMKKSLSSSWDLGSKEAVSELEMATKKKLSSDRFQAEPLYGEAASRYFDTRAFEMAGNFTDESRKIITNIMQQGVKYGKTLKQIEVEIYEAFSNKGYLTLPDMKELLGETLSDATRTVTPEVAASRLKTVIRTSVFEAINESRFSRFTDPDVEDFVEALQYSSILDRRTSKICQQLDDTVFSTDSELWNKYRPPNHFNCRSIVIPIVTGEEWSESDDPEVEIPEGFG